ncbi:membrane carboxypeptidase/penicillin-binding protein, partial [Paenibacillus sp. Aloe-11]
EVFVSGTEPKETLSGQNNPPAATQTDQAEQQAEKKSWWSNFKRWWME